MRGFLGEWEKKKGGVRAEFLAETDFLGEIFERETTPGNGHRNCKRRYIVREKRAERPHVEIE